MFERGGNAIDAACAMLAVVCTMHDDVGWGGETQGLVYNPRTRRVIGINACGVAPSGATPELFKSQDRKYPPGEGPLAAITPGNPGGLMVMLANFGTLSLREVLEPALQMADGYPIEAELVRKIETHAAKLKEWPYSAKVFLPHTDRERAAPRPGEIWRQPDLLDTLRKLVAAESEALAAGRDRQDAIQAAYDRFYRGDIAKEFVRGSQAQGGLITLQDLANWRVQLEEPVMTRYKDIEVYKLSSWTQGPALLQALNIREHLDLRAMGYNSTRYVHALYQTLSLAFADRDFYYGDPYFPPATPIQGLLSKDYARERLGQIDWTRNNPDIRPGDPYPYQGQVNPFLHHLTNWSNLPDSQRAPGSSRTPAPGTGVVSGTTGSPIDIEAHSVAFRAGTTSIQAADREGWVVSLTPSGGWLPSCLAGQTGMSMSQRMQSFVLNESENPFNVLAPGKRPRVTLTPTLALREGLPLLCFSVQGGDTQDQNLLQFFLNVVEFGMTVQEACEAANITSYQMRSSFGEHRADPGRLTLSTEFPSWTRRELSRMGYRLEFHAKTSGPITAIHIDSEQGTIWGGVSNHGEDYGIAW
jgi:gamma-glutamyltranspeptidase / glutathione hydrolase